MNELETGRLYEEFEDISVASYLRGKATGRMIIIRGLYCTSKADMRNLLQIITTEVLAEAAAAEAEAAEAEAESEAESTVEQ